MTENMIAQLKKLQAIKESLHHSHLPEQKALELLKVLDHIEAENKSLSYQLTSVRVITSNLLVESAKAGLPGALTGLGAEHVDHVAKPLYEGTLILQQLVHELVVQLQQQIDHHSPPS
ncbi:hypothetical protein [Gynuella sp.]|uniref:hypothetical protein n=1 Tax=Gynuella sp. TaxID=2969146 RepID=UPI003D0D21EF